MNDTALITYLNDHLAGSVVALELLDHVLSLQQQGPLHQSLTEIRGQIEEDRQILLRLLSDLGGKESPLRKAAAWLTEKLGQAKLRIDDAGSGQLRLLEALETLALGIQGKLALWRALETVAETRPHIAALNLSRLQSRAVEQFNRVDRLRLEVAREALDRA
jgi:hypothetical protein